MVVTALEIIPENVVVLVHVGWEMVEQEKVASMVVGTIAEKIEKRQEIDKQQIKSDNDSNGSASCE